MNIPLQMCCFSIEDDSENGERRMMKERWSGRRHATCHTGFLKNTVYMISKGKIYA